MNSLPTRTLRALLLPCLLTSAGASFAYPISWTDNWSGNYQLISVGEELTARLTLGADFNAATDNINGFTVSWELRDNDPDIYRQRIPYTVSYSCGSRFNRRTCYETRYTLSVSPGQTEWAVISTAGYTSPIFSVGNTCSGNACPTSIWTTVHTFSNTLDGIANLQEYGFLDVSVRAVHGDFLVGSASLSAFGERRIATAATMVPEPGILALLAIGFAGLSVVARRRKALGGANPLPAAPSSEPNPT